MIPQIVCFAGACYLAYRARDRRRRNAKPLRNPAINRMRESAQTSAIIYGDRLRPVPSWYPRRPGPSTIKHG